LPAELRADEASPVFAASTAARLAHFQSEGRAHEDAPLFISLMRSDRRGIVTMTLPDGRHCLMAFSHWVRAEDYRGALLVAEPRLGSLVSTPRELLQMLRDIEAAGITCLALDRCPRCPTFCIVPTDSIKTVDDVIRMWSASKSVQHARLELYLSHALNLARTGRFFLARDVALEIVGHVTPDDPRVHLLLGELGVALGLPKLSTEAGHALRLLNYADWEERLRQVVKSKSPAFATFEPLSS
jgi:hypothetical protein